MTGMHGTLVVLPVAGALLLLLAAGHDVLARTVPNALAGAIAVLGLGAQLIAGTAVSGVLAGFAVFFVAALGWRRGLMGGGDVKLLGAAALLLPAALVPTMLMATAISGGVLALVYLVTRRRIARPGGTMRPARLVERFWRAERWRLRRGGPLPYAVAIAFGAFFALSNGGS